MPRDSGPKDPCIVPLANGAPGGAGRPADRVPFMLGALLFLVVSAIFLPALGHDFTTYDDPTYVTQNTHVQGGLTWANVQWAFRSTEASNWHPLTWISHMADCQVFGLKPWGHHLTNVLLHAINALLLFVVLQRMTGAVWRSLFVAALFGLHPLHVETVAWVAERKDVLGTTFWMLVLWAYARRVERIGARGFGSRLYLGLAFLFFAMGLMCKPMLVTVPCVLLLLDYWPLGRWGRSSAAARWALAAEKIPFFALSAAASAATLLAQRRGGALQSSGDFQWPVRIANALIAYCRYLGKCFFPAKLAVFYPNFAEQPPLLQTVLAGLLLAVITAAAAALYRRRPYFLVGWLWFVGTLVPVIGLVQVGGQSMADRYTYVPLIGVFVIVAWAAGDATASWPRRSRVLGVAAGAVLVCCAALTSRQLSFWKDGASLFRHALAVTENNWVAHAGLGAALSKSSPAEGSAEFQKAMGIVAAFAETRNNRGLELAKTPGRLPDAIAEFRAAVQIMPDLADAHYNLGTALAKTPGCLPEAIAEFQTAVRLNPDFADAHYNLAAALTTTSGHMPEAIAELRTVLWLRPDHYQAHFMLGFLLSGITERQSEAMTEYEAATKLKPDSYEAHFNLGLLLSRVPGRTQEAIGHFESALKAKPDLEQARVMISRLSAAPR